MAPTVFCVAAVGWKKREVRDGMDWSPEITAPQRFWKTFGARFIIGFSLLQKEAASGLI